MPWMYINMNFILSQSLSNLGGPCSSCRGPNASALHKPISFANRKSLAALLWAIRSLPRTRQALVASFFNIYVYPEDWLYQACFSNRGIINLVMSRMDPVSPFGHEKEPEFQDLLSSQSSQIFDMKAYRPRSRRVIYHSPFERAQRHSRSHRCKWFRL